MVAAKTALRIQTVPGFMFGIGMTFFPTVFLGAYGGAIPEGTTSEIMAMFALGLLGLQALQSSMAGTAFSRKAVSERAAGLVCLYSGLLWFAILATDTKYLAMRKYPEMLPAAKLVPNYLINVAMIWVCVSGWRASGSPMPNVGTPKGILATPILVQGVNLGFFAAGLTFATQPFGDMYFPGQQAKVAPAQLELIHHIFMVAGVFMFCNIAMAWGASGVDADANYRILRTGIYGAMIYLGQFAREGMAMRIAGWDVPMYPMTFVQVFAVTFYCTSALGDHPVKVDKAA